MKTSKLERLGKSTLQNIVDTSSSILEVLTKAGLSTKGTGNYATAKRVFQVLSINLTGLRFRQKQLQAAQLGKLKPAVPLHTVLVKGSTYSRCNLKKRLLRDGKLEDSCNKCGILPVWQGVKLVLQLDHKNGDSLDNRLENLQLLCPNCHSQTSTFSGRKNRTKPPTNRHRPRFSQRKVIRPLKHELEELVKTHSFTALGRKFGVSDNAVRKWCKLYQIPL